MITIEEIRNKVNTYPDNEPVEALLNELILLYKVEQGMEDVKAGRVLSDEDFEKEMHSWLKSK